MNDESIVEQEILSERAAAEALQSIAGQYSYPGGSALLNVKAELVPQANSLASGSEQRFDTDGNYPIGFEHTSDDKEDDLGTSN